MPGWRPPRRWQELGCSPATRRSSRGCWLIRRDGGYGEGTRRVRREPLPRGPGVTEPAGKALARSGADRQDIAQVGAVPCKVGESRLPGADDCPRAIGEVTGACLEHPHCGWTSFTRLCCFRDARTPDELPNGDTSCASLLLGILQRVVCNEDLCDEEAWGRCGRIDRDALYDCPDLHCAVCFGVVLLEGCANWRGRLLEGSRCLARDRWMCSLTPRT